MRVRPQVLLFTLAALAVLATLPLGKGKEEEGRSAMATNKDTNARMWPCCDKCGLCLMMYPPKCHCLDLSERGCHPACRNCVRYIADNGISEQPPVYRCADLLTNFCQGCCTPAGDR